MLSFFTVTNCYHFCVNIFPSTYFVLSFLGCYNLCYDLMLSFLTVSKCHHFYVIIFSCTYFVLSFDVNINDNTLKIIPQKWYICDFNKKITPSASWKMITFSILKMIPNVCKLSIHGNDTRKCLKVEYLGRTEYDC